MSRVLVDSGVDWIGKIPNDWNVQPLGLYLKERKEKVSDKDFEPLSVTKNGIVPQLENAAKSDAHDDRKKVCKFDFVINSRSDRKQSCGLSYLDGSVSLINIVLKIYNYYPEYIKYTLDNNMFAEEFYRSGHGIVADLWTTKFSEMKHIRIPEPSYIEQKKIADYLNKQCSKIDEIIKDNNKEIELLEEYKKNIFTDVINKYELKYYKLKYIIAKKLQYGANSSGIEYKDELPRYIRITDISNNDLKNTDKLSLTNKDASGFILNDGDILFARSGGTVGKSFMYQKKYGKCAFAGYLIRAQFDDKELSHYVYNYTNSTLYDEWKKTIFIQSTIQNIGADKYSIMPIPIPIDKRKIKIINIKIKNITNKVDKVIEYRKQIIEKLEEYKKSLIYECVTGKREV